MVTIEEAKAQISQARQDISSRQEEASKYQQQLERIKKALPQPTQRNLRQEKALLGRVQRKEVERVKGQVSSKEQEIKDFQERLRTASEDVKAYETNVQNIEQQKSDILAEQTAIQQALKFYRKKIPSSQLRGTREYKYVKELEAQEGIIAEKYVSDIDKYAEDIKRLGGTVTNFERDTGTFTYTLPEKPNVNAIINAEARKGLTDRDLKVFDLVSAQKDGVTSKALSEGHYVSTKTGQVFYPTEIIAPDWFQKASYNIKEVFRKRFDLKPFDLVSAQSKENSKILSEPHYISTKTGQVIPASQRDLPDVLERTSFKVSEFIKKDPILSRIETPSKLGEDVKRISPSVYELATPKLEVRGIYNPILALASPVKPVPKSIPLRNLRQPEAFEIQIPKMVDGKQVMESSYTIYKEIKPPTLVRDSKGGLFGVSDKSNIRPAKVEVTTTPYKVLEKTPVVTLTTKGGDVGKLNVLTGDSIPTTLTNLKQQTPQQQYLWKQIAEKQVGRPVALENVPKILKEMERSQGNIVQKKVGKIDVRKKEIRLLEPRDLGKRVTQYETASQFKKVIETDKYELFKGLTFFKETTKPLSRQSGEVSELPTTILRVKEPLIKEDGISDINMLFPSGSKKTPLSVTFSKELIVTPKILPKIPKAKTIKTQGGSKQDGKSVVSIRNVGGISPIVGDKSTFSSTDFYRGFSKSFFGQEAKQGVEAQTRELLGTSQSGITKVSPRVMQGEVSKIISGEKISSKVFQRSQVAQKDLSRVSQGVSQNLKTSPKTIQKSGTKQKLFQKITPRPTPRPEPTKRIIKRKFDDFERKPTKKEKVSKKKPFEAFGRRYGVDKSLGTFKSKSEAEKELKEFQTETLGASGFIERGGEKIDVNLGSGFRPSKIDPKRVVQIRKKRLTTSGEKKEIKKARKIKWV